MEAVSVTGARLSTATEMALGALTPDVTHLVVIGLNNELITTLGFPEGNLLVPRDDVSTTTIRQGVIELVQRVRERFPGLPITFVVESCVDVVQYNRLHYPGYLAFIRVIMREAREPGTPDQWLRRQMTRNNVRAREAFRPGHGIPEDIRWQDCQNMIHRNHQYRATFDRFMRGQLVTLGDDNPIYMDGINPQPGFARVIWRWLERWVYPSPTFPYPEEDDVIPAGASEVPFSR